MGKKSIRKIGRLTVDYGDVQKAAENTPPPFVKEEPPLAHPDVGLDRHVSVMNGYAFRILSEVAESLGTSAEGLALRIGMSRSTFHRRVKHPKALLSVPESDALSRYTALLERANETFDGDESASRQWLNTAQPGLGGAIPLQLAQTTWGYLQVETLLYRIDYGVYA